MTTKAQVNVVMSDKALVKHLQKELARLESELRTPGPPSSACDYVALLKKKDLQIEKVKIQNAVTMDMMPDIWISKAMSPCIYGFRVLFTVRE